MNPIVTVKDLSKQYRIGAARSTYTTLRESLMATMRDPFRRMRDGLSTNGSTVWALKDVSFEVTPGEVVGIIGRNGAGKSTLLKILSRITEPTRGWARIRGRVGSLLEVGTGFHPELTGRENIYLNGAMLGMKKIEIKRQFNEIVAFSGVDKFVDTPVKHYSSGMYLRLAFAVAAHLEPEILLVDEVLAVGDAQFQKKCLGKMGEVAKEGRTVLFVSHNMAAVKSLCERAIWLDQGKIAKAGPTKQIADEYLQQGSRSTLERVWPSPADAPGNEKLKLRAARVRSLAQDGGPMISVESPIQVEFEFWNYQADALLNTSLHLFNIEGICVFAVTSPAQSRPLGLLKETVTIPANFLNDGVYSVSVHVAQDFASFFVRPEVLVFEVMDSARDGIVWFKKWPGVIRPRLDWLSENISDEALILG